MSIQQIIEVESKNRYGTTYHFPLNDTGKKAVKMFDNKKALSDKQIKQLKTMGYIIKQFALIKGRKVELCEL